MISANPLISLDELINRVGFGRFHLKQYCVVFLIVTNCLTHAVLTGYILPAITYRWQLSLIEQSFLGCLEYFMQLVASVITSHSTRFGRRKPIVVSMIVWTVSVGLTCLFDSFYLFCVFRGLTACSSLTCNLIAYTALSEVLPMNNRGKWLGSFEFVIVLGHVQILAYMFCSFESLGQGDIWLLFFFLFLSMAFTCTVCLAIIEESPRYLCFHNRAKECLEILEKIAEENGTNKENVGVSTERFMNWVETMEKEELRKSASNNFVALFKDHFKTITITLYFVWFANCLVSAGNDYILPTTLYKIFTNGSQNLMLMMLYMNIVTLPFLVPVVLTIDKQQFGRRKTLLFSLMMLAVSCFFAWLDVFLNLFVWLIIVKYAIAINYLILSIYTNEIYSTRLRSLGFGTSVSVGKIGSIFSPILSIYLSNLNPLLPFAVFAVISGVGALLLFNLSHDTTNEDMDKMLLSEDVELNNLSNSENKNNI